MAASTGFAFEGKNATAQAEAQAYGARMVREVGAETRAAINAIISQSIEKGIPPRQAARLIREVVGLTRRQALAVGNYHQRLRFSGLKPDQVWKKTVRFRDRKLRQRALNIARTETMGALNRGKLVAARQAKADGHFNQPVKRWVLTPDERLCPLCAPMENQSVPLDDQFSNGYDAPPRHPQCRCTISVVEGEVLMDFVPPQFRNLTQPGPYTPVPPAPKPEPKEGQRVKNSETYPDGLDKTIEDVAKLMDEAGFEWEKFPTFEDFKTRARHMGSTANADATTQMRWIQNQVREAINLLQSRGVTVASRVYVEMRFEHSEGYLGRAFNPAVHKKGSLDNPTILYEGKRHALMTLNIGSQSGVWRGRIHAEVYGEKIWDNRWSAWDPKKLKHPPARTFVHELGHLNHLHKFPGEKYHYGRSLNELDDWTVLAHAIAEKGGLRGLVGKQDSPGVVKDINRYRGNLESVAQEVSNYAATRPGEFVAEVFAGGVQGIPYSKMVWRLYDWLKGPTVPGRKIKGGD